MMKRTRRMYLALLAILISPMAANADPIYFDIGWTGSGGYTMTGMFSFDDSLLGTGAIDETSVLTFMIEGFHNGVSLGTWDLIADGLVGNDTFNFNFDTTLEEFIVGGNSTSLTGQAWGVAPGAISCEATGFGFGSGSTFQGFCIEFFTDASALPTSQSTLTASRTVPEPSELLEELNTVVTGEGPGSSLADKIMLAQAYLAVPDEESACLMLGDFLNQVRAQRGKKLTEEQADQFTSDAAAIIAAIGCAIGID